jgi:hypothetical protein
MDLETSLEIWLKDKAGLGEPRLTLAINACNEGAVYSVKDLLELYEMDKDNFEKAFPQAMIRSKLQAALEKDKNNIKAQDSAPNKKESPTIPTVSSSSATIPQTEQQKQRQDSATKNTDPALQLPPDKLYHFFASHKVRRSFKLCVFGSFVFYLLLTCCSENTLCARLHIRSYRTSSKGLAGRRARPPRLFRCTWLI